MGSRKFLYLVIPLLCVLIGIVLVVVLKPHLLYARLIAVNPEKKTIADRLEQYGAQAQARLLPAFQESGLVYPPSQLVLLGLKSEKVLELWAMGPDTITNTKPIFIKSYPILGASGKLGPKIREGDMQVPEGLYRIESLNPNSRFHLSLRVNYPNAFDRQMGEQDGRSNLGSDIMIHGKSVSIGCLAMGDEAAEELFVIAADVGVEHISVILAPIDFRVAQLDETQAELPDWTKLLYATIQQEIGKLGGLKRN